MTFRGAGRGLGCREFGGSSGSPGSPGLEFPERKAAGLSTAFGCRLTALEMTAFFPIRARVVLGGGGGGGGPDKMIRRKGF